MKIVHINTHDTGGAAIASLRLHESLLRAGIDSTYLVLYKTSNTSNCRQHDQSIFKFLFKKIRNRIFLTAKETINLIEGSKGNFTFFDSIYDILSNPIVKNADIIHFHWVSNFVDLKSFFSKNKKPLVWTFHDKNPISGGCHYEIDKRFLNNDMLQLEETLKQSKLRIFKGSNVLVISPSEWLKDEIKHSIFNTVFDKISVIPNGVNFSEFQLIKRDVAQIKLGLNTSFTYILVIASDLTDYRKGFDLVQEVIEESQHIFRNLKFLIMGELKDPVNYQNTICYGKVLNITDLNIIYSAADATLLASREDNLPNVMIESLACGTPVVGYGIGGIIETIEPGINGLVTYEYSVDSLLNLLEDFLHLKNAFLQETIRAQALDRYNIEKQMQLVTMLYRSVI